jgi:hypothetical protein
MIVAIINWLTPVPVFLLHVIALLPFIMTNVLVMMFVMMIVMMILGKRRGADKAGGYRGNG